MPESTKKPHTPGRLEPYMVLMKKYGVTCLEAGEIHLEMPLPVHQAPQPAMLGLEDLNALPDDPEAFAELLKAREREQREALARRKENLEYGIDDDEPG